MSGQNVVVWPDVIALEDDGIFLSILELLAVMIQFQPVEMGQESLEILEKKWSCQE
ncbi:TPA: hypothetical protein I9276_000352 [Legionella pneumophila]|nr:hypothetical protein [Legionella pneumophila]